MFWSDEIKIEFLTSNNSACHVWLKKERKEKGIPRAPYPQWCNHGSITLDWQTRHEWSNSPEYIREEFYLPGQIGKQWLKWLRFWSRFKPQLLCPWASSRKLSSPRPLYHNCSCTLNPTSKAGICREKKCKVLSISDNNKYYWIWE